MHTRFVAVLLGAALAVPSLSAAGDKSQSTMVNPLVVSGAALPALTGPLSASWKSNVSSGKTKGDDKCKVQIELKKIGLPDSDQTVGSGDEVICITQAIITTLGMNLTTGLIQRGEVKGGAVKIKADLAAQGTGCTPAGSGSGVVTWASSIACYEPDPGYAPAITLPFISDGTQGTITPGFAPRPSTGLISTNGIFFDGDAACVDTKCTSNPCRDGGDAAATCTDLVAPAIGYSCMCSAGFSFNGVSCVSACGSFVDPCGHGGTCNVSGGGWTCSCPAGYVSSGGTQPSCIPVNACDGSQTCPSSGNASGTGCATVAARECSADNGQVLVCVTSGSCNVWHTDDDCGAAGLACNPGTGLCTCPENTSATFYANSNPAVAADRAAHPSLVQTGVRNPAICSYESLAVAANFANAYSGSGFVTATAVASGADASTPVLVFPVDAPVVIARSVILTTEDDPAIGGSGFVPGRYVLELRRPPMAGDVDSVVDIQGTTNGGGSLRGLTVRGSAGPSANATNTVRCTGTTASGSLAGSLRVSNVGLQGATVIASGSGGSLAKSASTMTFTVPEGTDFTGADTADTQIVILDAGQAANDGAFSVTGVDLQNGTVTYTNAAGSAEASFSGRFVMRRPHFDTSVLVDNCVGGFDALNVSDFATGFHAAGTSPGGNPGSVDLTNSTFVRNQNAVTVDPGATVNQTNVSVVDDL